MPSKFLKSPQKKCYANVCFQGSDMNLRAKIKELQHFKGLEISPRFSYYLLNAIVIAPKTLCVEMTQGF